MAVCHIGPINGLAVFDYVGLYREAARRGVGESGVIRGGAACMEACPRCRCRPLASEFVDKGLWIRLSQATVRSPWSVDQVQDCPGVQDADSPTGRFAGTTTAV